MSQTESNWDKYLAKKVTKQVKPWHLLNPGKHITEEVSAARLNVCMGCERFIKSTKQCRECGCIMPMKVKLKAASCPLGLW